MRPPSRNAGREEPQVVAQVTSSSYENVLRASGEDGVMTRLFYTTEVEQTLFRSVPLPVDFSFERALRMAAWFADRACGVVTTRIGLVVRVFTADFEEIVKLAQPENNIKFLGEVWNVSGLPLSWRSDA